VTVIIKVVDLRELLTRINQDNGNTPGPALLGDCGYGGLRLGLTLRMWSVLAKHKSIYSALA
jgi:hypothetical protein